MMHLSQCHHNCVDKLQLVNLLCLLILHLLYMGDFLLISLSYMCPTVGISFSEANTVITMQDNPSYTPMEEDVTLEPNPCYSAMQANSDYEPISGETGWCALHYL